MHINKQINNTDVDFKKVDEMLSNPNGGRVKHTFEFYTTPEWHPGNAACWAECPFSFNIRLGQSCACHNTDKKWRLECPFVKQAVDVWVGGQPE